MENYLKIPVEGNTKELADLINNLLQKQPEWDGNTLVNGIVIEPTTVTFKMSKFDGSESSQQDITSTQKLLSNLGFIYEYNL